MNLILFGFKGCGKTYYGKRVAAKLHLPFIDTDDLIEQLYFKRYHSPLSCRQIALEKGGVFFRKLEKEVIHSLSIEKAIIALGGGAVLDEDNVSYLKKLGKLVYLKIDKETLKKRMLSNELPSFLDPNDPEESFENMYHDRKKKYEDIGAAVIDLREKTEQAIIEALIYGK